MKILISAAEASSDLHAAELLEALRRQLGPGEEVEAFGIGGPRLEEAGLRAVVPARELLAMGFSEVLGRLPKILRALNTVTREAERSKPELAIVADYPDFHFKLAERLVRQGVPVVYFIPPKVWVWRKSRIKKLKKYFAKVLCILPFEEEFYRSEGMAVSYVGNPLVDELPLDLTREEARRRLGLKPEAQVLLLMPGSRPAELKRHLLPMLDAADRLAERLGRPLEVLMPIPLTADRGALEQRTRAWMSGGGAERAGRVKLRLSQGDSAECMVAADAGLVKSGTSTLEAGLLGCPHAVVYQPSPLTTWIFRNLIRYPGPVGLVNLVSEGPQAKEHIAREILHEEVTAEVLADEAYSLMCDPERRERMKRKLESLRKVVIGSRPEARPSDRAAQEVLAILKGRRAGRETGKGVDA